MFHGKRVAASFVVIVAVSSCTGSSINSTKSGKELAKLIIPAPRGYAVDTTPGSYGALTPSVFAHYGGVSSASLAGFVSGYKGNYVSSATQEGLSVALLEFHTPSEAHSYLDSTAHQTLSFAAPTYKPFPAVPDAVEADGTKSYNGEYAHGVVMVRGDVYAQLAYFTIAPAQLPFEFQNWARAQYFELSKAPGA